LLLAALATAGIACGDPPTQPHPDETCIGGSTVPYCSASNAPMAAAARDAASDAASRSTPALDNATTKSALGTSLSALNTALAEGNITQARAAVTNARNAIATGRSQLSSFPGDAADLAAIELALDQVAPLLGVS
jgi:hypothetical protein